MSWNIQPTQDEIYFLMESGYIYCDACRFQEARDVFSGVRALLPQSEVPDIALGTVSFAEGDLDDALRSYQRALKKNQMSSLAYAHLGEAYFFKNELEPAVKNLNRAIEIDPKGDPAKMARALLCLTDAIEEK